MTFDGRGRHRPARASTSPGPKAPGKQVAEGRGRSALPAVHQQVRPPVLVQELPAAPAGRQRAPVAGHDRHGHQAPSAGGGQVGHQPALGAEGDAVAGVLHVAAAHQPAVLGHAARPHQHARVGGVGALGHRPRLAPQQRPVDAHHGQAAARPSRAAGACRISVTCASRGWDSSSSAVSRAHVMWYGTWMPGAAQLQHRRDVRPHRVADHAEGVRRGAHAPKHPRVGGGVLLGHDLDALEALGHARRGHLRLLVEEVALGDQDEPVALRQHVERLGHPVEQLDRVGQQLLAQGDDHLHVRAVDAVLGDREGGLDHRQREALDPVAEQGQVAPLGLEQCGGDAVGVHPRRQQLAVALLGQVVVPLAVPEGVVPVDAHHVDRHGFQCNDVRGRPTRAGR